MPSLFEHLPDETLLDLFSYLKPCQVIQIFFDLNYRLNRTLASYRRDVRLAKLSLHEFEHVYCGQILPQFYSTIRTLRLNNQYTLGLLCKEFEKIFKLDYFICLKHLSFDHIDAETLEAFLWRIRELKGLDILEITIDNEQNKKLPLEFDQFLCGKLLTNDTCFRTLSINMSNYGFNLEKVGTVEKVKDCPNIVNLTIRIQSLKDLYILFDHLPNIECLNIELSANIAITNIKYEYPFDRLYWKVRYLKQFHLSIISQVYRQDSFIEFDLINNIVGNLANVPLEYFRFSLSHTFTSFDRTITISNKLFLDYLNGVIWEQLLKKLQKLTRFELNIEYHSIRSWFASNEQMHYEFSQYSIKNETFSSDYWLHKGWYVNYCRTSSQLILYTLPCQSNSLSRTIPCIQNELSNNNLRFVSHPRVTELHLSQTEKQAEYLAFSLLIEKYPNIQTLSFKDYIPFVFPTSSTPTVTITLPIKKEESKQQKLKTTNTQKVIYRKIRSIYFDYYCTDYLYFKSLLLLLPNLSILRINMRIFDFKPLEEEEDFIKVLNGLKDVQLNQVNVNDIEMILRLFSTVHYLQIITDQGFYLEHIENLLKNLKDIKYFQIKSTVATVCRNGTFQLNDLIPPINKILPTGRSRVDHILDSNKHGTLKIWM